MKPKYEWLKVKNIWTGKYVFDNNEEYVSWEEDIPEGWRKAFGQIMVEELNNLLMKYDFADKYVIVQIKEKFGSLRWYDNGVPIEMTNEYYNWLNKYEKLSLETCIKCGDKATHMTQGWIIPLCNKCAKRETKRNRG